jgi:hypothetical protein
MTRPRQKWRWPGDWDEALEPDATNPNLADEILEEMEAQSAEEEEGCNYRWAERNELATEFNNEED